MEVTPGPKHQSPIGPYCAITSGLFQFGFGNVAPFAIPTALRRSSLLCIHGLVGEMEGEDVGSIEGRAVGSGVGDFVGDVVIGA